MIRHADFAAPRFNNPDLSIATGSACERCRIPSASGDRGARFDSPSAHLLTARERPWNTVHSRSILQLLT